MIQIERIRMHLPPGFEHRATTISQLIGKELSQKSITDPANVDSLKIYTPKISASARDDEIAAAITQQILASLNGGQ